MNNSHKHKIHALYLSNAKHMAQYAYRILQNKEVAEDLTQEAFLTLVYKPYLLDEHSNLPAWLFKTLHNLIMNEARKVRYQREVPLYENLAYLLDAPVMKFFDDDFIETLPDTLSDDDKQLLILRFAEDLTCEEIAKRIGIAPGTCRQRLRRALLKVKRHSLV